MAALAAIGGAIIAAVLIARGCNNDDAKTASVPPAPSTTTTATTTTGTPVAPTATAPIDQATLGKITSVAKLEEVLADYQANAMYPIWSRPHDEGTKYKLEWNKPAVSDLPLSDSDPLYYRFAADKAHVTYGDPYTAWIEAWEGNDDQKRVPIKVTDAYIMALSGPKPGRLVQLQFKDDGLNGDEKAGDLRYTVRFVPSEIPEMKLALQVRLSAVIERGTARRLAVREFTYAPRPVVVVEGITDSIKDGNMVVTLAVDVLERGTHTIEANVMSADDKTAIGWVKDTRTLEVGKQTFDCKFFGKIFHDKQVDGPYVVKDIRGFLRFPDEKEMPIWWKHEGTHLTKAYKPVDLSAKEWESPEKTETINRMKTLIADTKAGAIGQPTDKPKHIHIDENGKATEVP